MTKAQFDGRLDRIHELERAAETSRAEHAAALAELADEKAAHDMTRDAVTAAVDEWNGVSAALGLATARIRELEGERDELLGLLQDAKNEIEGDPDREYNRLAIVARIEKAGKGTTK